MIIIFNIENQWNNEFKTIKFVAFNKKTILNKTYDSENAKIIIIVQLFAYISHQNHQLLVIVYVKLNYKLILLYLSNHKNALSTKLLAEKPKKRH